MSAIQMSHGTRYLTNSEAAAYLNLSPRTLENWRVLGGGPRFRKFGRRVIYAIDDLELWAVAQACLSTSDAKHQGASDDTKAV
jgi:helix-turn-helix protein